MESLSLFPNLSTQNIKYQSVPGIGLLIGGVKKHRCVQMPEGRFQGF